MKPSDYKHIAAFGRTAGMTNYRITRHQMQALKEGAPSDAVYPLDPRSGRSSWATIGECGGATQRAIEVELNRGKP